VQRRIASLEVERAALAKESDKASAARLPQVEREIASLRERETAMRATVDWYLQHRDWWERIRNGAYMKYYETMYGNR